MGRVADPAGLLLAMERVKDDNLPMATKDRTRARSTSMSKGRSAPGAPAHASAAPNLVSTDGVLALQQTAGNTAVQRALSVQRDDDLVPSADNPVVGLKNQDGLAFGTFDKRPRVKLLQTKLNEKVGSGLSVDGMWGKKTSGSLESFQLSRSTVPTEFVDQDTGDALMDRGGGGGGGKDKPPPTPQVDPALEDMLDSIWLQHQVLLDTQRDSLTRLEADLAAQELPTDLALEIVKFIVKTAAGALFGAGTGFLTKKILEGLADANMSAEDQELAKTGLDKIFEAAKGAVESFAEEKVTDLMAKGEKGVDVFIDGQRSTLLDVSAAQQDAFLLEMKPRLRQPIDPKPGQPIETPLERARKLKNSVRGQRTNAFEQQYRESLAAFGVGQSRTGLGTTNGPGEQGTDMSKEAFDKLDAKSGKDSALRGVIELDVVMDEKKPTEPVAIDDASILGLSEKTRARLTNSDLTLGDVGLPIFASDKGAFENTELRISQNENGQRFDSGCETDALAFLDARGKKAKAISPPEQFTGSDIAAGIQDIFENDINKARIKSINGGKGLEKS